MAIFLSSPSKNCDQWFKDCCLVERNDRDGKRSKATLAAKIGQQECLNPTLEIYRMISKFLSGMTRRKVMTREGGRGKISGLATDCRGYKKLAENSLNFVIFSGEILVNLTPDR